MHLVKTPVESNIPRVTTFQVFRKDLEASETALMRFCAENQNPNDRFPTFPFQVENADYCSLLIWPEELYAAFRETRLPISLDAIRCWLQDHDIETAEGTNYTLEIVDEPSHDNSHISPVTKQPCTCDSPDHMMDRFQSGEFDKDSLPEKRVIPVAPKVQEAKALLDNIEELLASPYAHTPEMIAKTVPMLQSTIAWLLDCQAALTSDETVEQFREFRGRLTNQSKIDEFDKAYFGETRNAKPERRMNKISDDANREHFTVSDFRDSTPEDIAERSRLNAPSYSKIFEAGTRLDEMRLIEKAPPVEIERAKQAFLSLFNGQLSIIDNPGQPLIFEPNLNPPEPKPTPLDAIFADNASEQQN